MMKMLKRKRGKKTLCILLITLLFNCKQNNSNSHIKEEIVIEKHEGLEANKKTQTTYPIYYTQIKPDSTKIDSININQSAYINNIQFITGKIDGNKNGTHLIVKNSMNKILYKSEGQQDS